MLLVTSVFPSQLLTQKLNPETTEYRYWICFIDKGEFKPGDDYSPGSEGYLAAKAGLTEKTLWRRSKVLPQDKIVGYNDIPVNTNYINGVKELGGNPHAVSKWLNAVSIMARKDLLDKIKLLPYVEKIEGVHFLENVNYLSSKTFTSLLMDTAVQKNKYRYGISYWQNQQINVPKLHNMGVTGFGVSVGMCDDGFNWRKHVALRTRDVKGEYDWIYKDDSVQFQEDPNQLPEDDWDQDGHGTATMSTLGGFYEGELIGPAFDVSFYLSKTEKSVTETPIEEDFWLEGVEWMESQGVDVISSSLIYKPFDLPHNQYTYKDMNGKTTITVRAAELAASLGVVIVNSMGNEYHYGEPSIVSPPDGEHVISVGAVDSAGEIAIFSSNGPTSDGRIKPDVVAMGVDVYVAATYSTTFDTNGYSFMNGTSFSGPLTAGVCALMLSVHPELTPAQVMESLKMTANNKDTPNNIYGWGLIDAYDAVLHNGMIISNKPEFIKTSSGYVFSVHVDSKNTVKDGGVLLYYSLEGGEFESVPLSLTEAAGSNNSGKYSAIVPFDPYNDNVTFYISASDETEQRTVPYNAPVKFFYINKEKQKLEIF